MSFVKWMDDLSKELKMVFCILFLDITWMIYRIIKAADAKNTLAVIIWILITVFLGYVWWIVDLITMAVYGKIIEFNNSGNVDVIEQKEKE